MENRELEDASTSLIHWVEENRNLEQVEEVTSLRVCKGVLGNP